MWGSPCETRAELPPGSRNVVMVKLVQGPLDSLEVTAENPGTSSSPPWCDSYAMGSRRQHHRLDAGPGRRRTWREVPSRLRRSDAEKLAELVSLIDEGVLTLEVTRRIPLAELPALHAEAAEGRVAGKVIVIPQQSTARPRRPGPSHKWLTSRRPCPAPHAARRTPLEPASGSPVPLHRPHA